MDVRLTMSATDTGFPSVAFTGEADDVQLANDREFVAVSPFNGPPRLHQDKHQGSNIDLPAYAEIDEELSTVPLMLDAALRRLDTAMQSIPDLRYQMRLRWAHALDKATRPGRSPTQARADAELEVRSLRLELERAEWNRDVASKIIDVFRARLSAAQTRAKMWTTQYSTDHFGPGL